MDRPRLPNASRIVVRLPNWVGDVLMSTPVLARLRALNPVAEIVALARANVAPLVAGNPNLDAIWVIDDQTVRGWREALRHLRRQSFDWGLLLPNSFQSALILRICGIRALRGYNRDGRRMLLAEPIPFCDEYYSVHDVINYLRLLDEEGNASRAAGIPEDRLRPGMPKLEYTVLDEDREQRNRFLREHKINSTTPLLLVTPGAAYGSAKRWDLQRFGEAAARIAAPRSMTILLSGTTQESEACQQVVDAIRAHAGAAFPVYNFAGQIDLRLLGAFLETVQLQLSNDSGPMHFAAAVGTPVVAVFGPTDWMATAPWSSKARMVRVPTECAPCQLRHCPIDHRCMTGVSVEAVVGAATELLSSSPSK